MYFLKAWDTRTRKRSFFGSARSDGSASRKSAGIFAATLRRSMSSAISVSFIQKLRRCELGNTNSMPRSAGSDGRNIMPLARSSSVRQACPARSSGRSSCAVPRAPAQSLGLPLRLGEDQAAARPLLDGELVEVRRELIDARLFEQLTGPGSRELGEATEIGAAMQYYDPNATVRISGNTPPSGCPTGRPLSVVESAI